MKRTITTLLFSFVLFFTLTSELMDDDGRAGSTGSPGETTCNTSNCHNSFVLNSGNGSITATCNMVNWKYEPLTTYTINIKVAKPGVGLFGFGVELLTSTNTNAGLLIVTDAVHTQIKSRTVNGVSRRNIVHKLNGGLSADSMIFTFNWTSPDTTVGPVTMYFAGNAANGTGTTSGDYIYSATQTISPSQGTWLEKPVTADPFTVFPNPAKENINVHYNLHTNDFVEIRLYDMKTSASYLLLNSERPAGTNNEVLSIPSDCKSGLYMLSLVSSRNRVVKKMFIN
jgi:hypothetical protein